MSKVEVEYSLGTCWRLKTTFSFFSTLHSALFRGGSCPYSTKFAQDKTRTCTRVSTDDKASLCEKHFVEVVPAILGFRKGKITGRLAGVPGEGLTEKQLGFH